MTPRTFDPQPKPGDVDHRQEIEYTFAYLEPVVAEAHALIGEGQALLSRCQQAVFESPEVRMVAARAFLDRADEIRSTLSSHARYAKRLLTMLEHHVMVEKGTRIEDASNSLAGRGLAAEERLALYAFRSRAVMRKATEARALAEQIIAIDRDFRDVVRSIDGHRMEAITNFKGSVRVSRDEYLSFRST